MARVKDILSAEELAAIDLAAVALRKLLGARRGRYAFLEYSHDLAHVYVDGRCIATGDIDQYSTDLTPGEALADVELP